MAFDGLHAVLMCLVLIELFAIYVLYNKKVVNFENDDYLVFGGWVDEL